MNSDGTDNTTDKTPETSAVPPIISEDTAASADNRETDLNENRSPEDLNTPKVSEEQTTSENDKQSEPPADEIVKIPKPAVSKKQKNYILHNTIQILSGIIIGVSIGYLLLYLLIPKLFTPAEFLLILVFIFLSLFINLNVYKLGQLIAGRIYGGQFIAYQFTCLRFYRAEGTLHRRLTPSHSFEGECSVIPPSNQPYSANIYIAFYTGGVAACAFVGCVCIITAIIMSSNTSGSLLFSDQPNYFIMFLWINAFFSLIYAAFCLIPVFWNDSPSDGLILFALLKKNPYTAQLIILRMVTVQLAAGIRPSDIHIPDIIPVRIIREKTGRNIGLRLIAAVKKTLSRLYIWTGKLKSSLVGKVLNTVFPKPKPDTNSSVIDQAINNIDDAVTAAEISDIPQFIEPEDISDDIPEEAEDKPPSKKIRFNIGILVYKIKLWICPDKINKGVLEIEQFPSPAENEYNVSAITLLLKLYHYYIALDNAEHTDMQANLLMIEKNINRVPVQMLQRVYRELCFYYSIDKNPASAAHYMEMMERSTEQKKHIDNLRVRAYFELYINRRYKTAFSLCRSAMENAVADSSSGLTVMNRELIKGLVILIHQKSSLSKSE
ncbi:MAG: hypothetical protein ACYCWE_01510 [Eubacteriales bacterium]